MQTSSRELVYFFQPLKHERVEIYKFQDSTDLARLMSSEETLKFCFLLQPDSVY